MMPDTAQTPTLSNAAFLTHLGEDRPAGSSLWVTCFTGSPDLTDASNWGGQPLTPSTPVDQWAGLNTYFSVANLKANLDGEILRRRVNFASLAALVVDDVLLDDVFGQISWCLETSPGKFQIGIFLDQADPDTANRDLCDRLIGTLASATGADASGNNCVRYVRLPVGTNHKARQSGPAAHRMHRWAADVRLPLTEASSVFGVDLDTLRQVKSAPVNQAGNIVLPAQLAEAKSALAALDADQYDSWVTMGMALHSTGLPEAFGVWCEWSANSSKYRQEDQSPKWQSFSVKRDKAVSIRTLFARAQAAGWKNPLQGSTASVSPDGLLLDMAQLQAKSKGIKWAIKNVIPENSIGMFYGASGTYKSFISLDMGLHAAHNMNWLDRRTKGGAVVYIAAEGGAGIWNRIDAWHRQHKLKPDAPFYVCPVALNLGQDADARAIGTAIDRLEIAPRYLFIDTFSQTFAGDENKREEVTKYLRILALYLREKYSCVVIIVHHTGHSATERPRGSSALIADLDFLFGVFREKDDCIATVECLKQKDGDKLDPINFKVVRHVLGHDEDGDEVSSLVATSLDTVAAILASATEKANSHQARFLSVTKTGVEIDQARKDFYALLPIDMNPDTKKKAWQRTHLWAEKAGLRAVENGCFQELA